MVEISSYGTPYSAVCYILVQFPNGTIGRGSGVVVGTNDVLTAMHVVYNAQYGGYASKIVVIPGADTSPSLYEPYGRFEDVGSVNGRVPDWDLNGNGGFSVGESATDLALIGLRSRIADVTGTLGVSSQFQNFSGVMIGYPARGTGLMVERGYADTTTVAGVYHLNSSMGHGASGGPLVTDANGVVGIFSGASFDDTHAYYASLGSWGNWEWLMAALSGNDYLIGGGTPPGGGGGTTRNGTQADDDYLFGTVMPAGALTISDPGGTDTFNAYLVAGNHVIDLNAGNVSTIGANTVNLSAGTVIEHVLSYDGNDRITGNAAVNWIWSEGGNDQLKGGGADDFLDGGAGTDTAIYVGTRNQYLIDTTDLATYRTLYVFDGQAGRDGIDDLVDIERVQFSDASVAFDTAGAAGQAYRLYQAAFNRSPDQGGLGYQMAALDNGWSLVAVAQNFINSPEFSATYGSLNTTQFVTQLYANVLHRSPDAGGLAYHTSNIDAGMSRAQVLVGFSESPENQAALIGVISSGMVYTL